MIKKQLIYIAGKYSATTEEVVSYNVDRAIEAGLEIYKRGHIPFIPHLTKMVSDFNRMLDFPDLKWEEYMAWCLEYLKRCDALFYLSSSKGADIELIYAQKRGMKVYFSLDDIPKAEDVNEQAI